MNHDLLLFYLIASTLGLGFIAVKWSKADFTETVVKLFYSLVTIIGLFLTLKALGVL